MTNEECRTALKRIAGYMCAMKDLEALTYAMDVLEHISSELAKNSKKLEKNIGELDCISRKRAIERLKLNLPISDGADNSRDRHRYMQSLADIQAIRELPTVTPQEPILDKIREQIKDYLRGVEITLEVLVENDPLRPKMEGAKDTLEECLELIDKAESEGKEQEDGNDD